MSKSFILNKINIHSVGVTAETQIIETWQAELAKQKLELDHLSARKRELESQISTRRADLDQLIPTDEVGRWAAEKSDAELELQGLGRLEVRLRAVFSETQTKLAIHRRQLEEENRHLKRAQEELQELTGQKKRVIF